MFHRHETRETFTAINIIIVGLEVLAAIALLFGLIGGLALMISPLGGVPSRDDVALFILVAFGGIASSFCLLGMAEFLQLMLKIEYNTRRAR